MKHHGAIHLADTGLAFQAVDPLYKAYHFRIDSIFSLINLVSRLPRGCAAQGLEGGHPRV